MSKADPDFKAELAGRIRAVREARNLSNDAFAAAMGYSKDGINGIVSTEGTDCYASTLALLCQRLNANPGWLLLAQMPILCPPAGESHPVLWQREPGFVTLRIGETVGDYRISIEKIEQRRFRRVGSPQAVAAETPTPYGKTGSEE